MVDKDAQGFCVEKLRDWKRVHEAMIAEVRTQGWSRSLELLRFNQNEPAMARLVVALFEDRRVFWARFDAEFPDRVRMSLCDLRHDLTGLRSECSIGSPLDLIVIALGQTIRHFFDIVEKFDLSTLRCDSRDINWQTFDLALHTLRKAVAYQIAELASAYAIPVQGEFAAHFPQPTYSK